MKAIPMLLVLVSCACAGEEKSVVPTFDSLGLFKNGMAVARASFRVDGPGLYRWDTVPRAVHGTLWVESDGAVEIRTTMRTVETSNELATGDFQRDLAGKAVDVLLKSQLANVLSFSGTVWDAPPKPPADLSATSDPFGSQRFREIPPPTVAGNFLILTTADGGRRYLDRASIASVSLNGPFTPAARKEERPVLIFDVRDVPAGGGVVRVSYLTHGLAWMPSYRVDLTNPAKLAIRQNAVVRDEMSDFSDAELQLISGYPNVRFGTVDSPLWPGTSLAAFFQQVNQSGSASSGVLSNALSQQAVYMNSASTNSAAFSEPAESGNASDDIHYESIGKRSMKAGDSLSLDVAAATADYERVVEWTVPDPRDERGRYRSAGAAENDAWDAVRFANPFVFPMTTAAATIVEGGKFRGQSQSDWVNPGQRTCLRITRALSVRTQAGEVEEEGKREMVWIGGNDFQRTTVKGTLTVRNFRGTEATLVIRAGFSGELLEAEGDPAKSLRTEGVSSVNPRRDLEWTVKLPAGGEKSIGYRYAVLVDR
jgi:hypothetical protein